MFEWLVKKILCGKINSLLNDYKGNVDKVRSTLNVWIWRIEKVLACLKSILTKLDDNQIDSDEVKDIVDEVTKLVREW